MNKPEFQLHGVPASPGIAIGRVKVLSGDLAKPEKKEISESQIVTEIEILQRALQNSIKDLQATYKRTAAIYGEEPAQIFLVHQTILTDPVIVDECIKRINNERISAENAFSLVMEKYVRLFTGMSDEVFRSRSTDLRDLTRRVIRYLHGEGETPTPKLDETVILFARELTPSDTVRLEREKVLGFAMDFGARTSHATIIARSIRVPAIVGLNNAAEKINDGDLAILDGDEGVLILSPSAQTLARYEKKYTKYQKMVHLLESIKSLPARTLDGKDIDLASNIEFPNEVDGINDLGIGGIGLYRTEYLFLSASEDPSEEQQFLEYKEIVRKLNPKSVIIRTFDLGGDKLPTFLHLPAEQNPFLGVRGIRLYQNGGKEIFHTQLRAIIRASVFGSLQIMLPMISCVSEVTYCREIINKVKEELRREGKPFAESIPLGAMIEVPSAAVSADIIAAECDFLSIGTNDLIQYTLAVDRGNKNMDYLYQAHSPAVIRLINDVIHKGHQKGVWVGMCGEMASDSLMTMILIGMGLDEFSVSPVSHLLIKKIIRSVDVAYCQKLTEEVLRKTCTKDVSNYLKEKFHNKFPELK